MARKSRKNIPEVVSSATVQTEVSRPFRAGLYARISMETEETLERGTIETQVELMKNFVADTEDIAVAEIYKDSDYSGTNFDRPGFTQMMEDIKHGKINCVIVKDLSRLGRNYVETSNYIERVFPFFHVRFLAVTDDFDSFREGVDLTVPLKNIINEFYSKDLAKKSSSAKKALWKEGKFTGAWEPYGYRKSEQDRHQLVVDEEAAGHLREIFTMYMDGCSYSDIAKRLNTDGILSPTLQREYYKTGEKPSPESKPWNNYEVKRVLQDVHCTGDSVYGKYQQSVFQGNKQRNLPESEWLYAENTHEGIIDKELFRQVQEKIREFTEAYKKKHQLNNGAIRNHIISILISKCMCLIYFSICFSNTENCLTSTCISCNTIFWYIFYCTISVTFVCEYDLINIWDLIPVFIFLIFNNDYCSIRNFISFYRTTILICNRILCITFIFLVFFQFNVTA